MSSADKVRVLVVDDIAETRDIIRRQLQFDQMIEVVGLAGSGLEAIDLSQTSKPDVILICRIWMASTLQKQSARRTLLSRS
jgi:pilus assembly protein CpaE